MTDNSREININYGYYALAFGLALVLRLLRLGDIPLGDSEARWALQALDLVKGLHNSMGPQPLYVILTGVLFFAGQASNFGARLVPALFGAALCLAPFYFRDRLGSKAALVLAFFAAVDPTLLAISREAGSPIVTISAVLLAWGNWRSGKLRTAGIWSGVALLGGPALWPGLIGLLVAYGLLRGFFSDQPIQQSKEVVKQTSQAEAEGDEISSEQEEEEIPAWTNLSMPALPDGKAWISLAFYGVGTYLLLGSLFLMASGGLSAGLDSIPAYFGGWFAYPEVSIQRMLLGLGMYETLPILLGVSGLVRGILRRTSVTIMLGLWLLAATVLTMAYPSRQAADLAWVVLPLLSLAAVEFSGYLVPAFDGTWETIGMAAFTSAILLFVALNYVSISLVPMDPNDIQLRWWIIFGAVGLLLVSLAMVGFGWSFPTAIQGGLWGSLVVLFIYTFGTSMASAGLRSYMTFELWPSSPYIGQAQTLVSQMNDLSRWRWGSNTALDVTIAGVDSPALQWVLRDWNVTILPTAELGSAMPALVITPSKDANSSIAAAYRGQDFTWDITPLWDQGLVTDWLRWSIMHDFPKSGEKIILWARSDIFIDSQNAQ